MTVISYPVPAYQNLPIYSNFYLPSQFFITAISLGMTTTITTAQNHNYVVNNQVRLIIPPEFGTRQLNGLSAYVLSIPNPNQVIVSIDSTQMDAFILASVPNQPQILAIGDINFGSTNASGPYNQSTFIPGSFINDFPSLKNLIVLFLSLRIK